MHIQRSHIYANIIGPRAPVEAKRVIPRQAAGVATPYFIVLKRVSLERKNRMTHLAQYVGLYRECKNNQYSLWTFYCVKLSDVVFCICRTQRLTYALPDYLNSYKSFQLYSALV